MRGRRPTIGPAAWGAASLAARWPRCRSPPGRPALAPATAATHLPRPRRPEEPASSEVVVPPEGPAASAAAATAAAAAAAAAGSSRESGRRPAAGQDGEGSAGQGNAELAGGWRAKQPCATAACCAHTVQGARLLSCSTSAGRLSASLMPAVLSCRRCKQAGDAASPKSCTGLPRSPSSSVSMGDRYGVFGSSAGSGRQAAAAAARVSHRAFEGGMDDGRN